MRFDLGASSPIASNSVNHLPSSSNLRVFVYALPVIVGPLGLPQRLNGAEHNILLKTTICSTEGCWNLDSSSWLESDDRCTSGNGQ